MHRLTGRCIAPWDAMHSLRCVLVVITVVLQHISASVLELGNEDDLRCQACLVTNIELSKAIGALHEDVLATFPHLEALDTEVSSCLSTGHCRDEERALALERVVKSHTALLQLQVDSADPGWSAPPTSVETWPPSTRTTPPPKPNKQQTLSSAPRTKTVQRVPKVVASTEEKDEWYDRRVREENRPTRMPGWHHATPLEGDDNLGSAQAARRFDNPQEPESPSAREEPQPQAQPPTAKPQPPRPQATVEYNFPPPANGPLSLSSLRRDSRHDRDGGREEGKNGNGPPEVDQTYRTYRTAVVDNVETNPVLSPEVKRKLLSKTLDTEGMNVKLANQSLREAMEKVASIEGLLEKAFGSDWNNPRPVPKGKKFNWPE